MYKFTINLQKIKTKTDQQINFQYKNKAVMQQLFLL